MKITSEFLQYLRNKASEAESSVAYGGRYDDGEATHLRELICAYESGVEGKVPSFWIDSLLIFENENKKEYELYLKLKTKYEPI
jgi:aminoglycoside phosphotransferase family enzyme